MTCLVALNKVKPYQPSERLESVPLPDPIQYSWTLPLPNTLLLLPDPELLTQNAFAVRPTFIPAPPQDMAPPSAPAPRLPSPTSRRDAAVALITCVLVVIIGSLSNPFFVTIDSGLASPDPFSLPCCQVPETMPHDHKLLAMQTEAFKVGIPRFGEVLQAGIPTFGTILTAAVYKDLQVFVMPLLHVSQEVFISAVEQLNPVVAPSNAQESANHFRMGFLSWDQVLGSIIQLPYSCAFQVITFFRLPNK
jgi:hypothetical protein